MGKETINNYGEWLDTIASDCVYKLRVADEQGSLSKELVKEFVNLVRNYFGGRIFVELTKVDYVISSDANDNEFFLEGVIVEVNKDGITYCKHPWRDKLWTISRNKLKGLKIGELSEGMIISIPYDASKSEWFLADLIYGKFERYKNSELDFEKYLHFIGGERLVNEAKLAFNISEAESSLENVVAGYFLNSSNKIRMQLEEEMKNFENEKKTFEESKQKLSVEQTKWLNILNRIDEYINSDLNDIEENYIQYEWTNDDLPALLQNLIFHNDEDELIYDEAIIKSLLRALQSNVLAVLSGPSGTGKSSIVRALGKAMEKTKVRMIPVQSSWTDTQDLLGYFNPNEKSFVATPFMEALAEARLDPENLYLICLDEMNLSHVEYYFSEFLSKREEKNSSLHLYNRRYFKAAEKFIENAQNEEIAPNEFYIASELVGKYPVPFEMPKNVRFIGTLNMDHTVKPLSPKVIDRSFVIEINHLTKEKKDEILNKVKATPMQGKAVMNLELFQKVSLSEEEIQNELKSIEDISNILDRIPNASLNSRGMKHIKNFLMYAGFRDALSRAEYIDHIIIGKILPRIEVSAAEFKDIKENLAGSLKSYPKSTEKLEQMTTNKRIVRFW